VDRAHPIGVDRLYNCAAMPRLGIFLRGCAAAALTAVTFTSPAAAASPPPPPLDASGLNVTCGTVARALLTIRTLESNGDYAARSDASSASGAYGMLDATWRSWTAAAGEGSQYRHAWQAPPLVQDQVAGFQVAMLLAGHHQDVSVVPVFWYVPTALVDPSQMDVVPLPSAGNILTPRQYQTFWMNVYGHREVRLATTCPPPETSSLESLVNPS
jgi:hypothetical protein